MIEARAYAGLGHAARCAGNYSQVDIDKKAKLIIKIYLFLFNSRQNIGMKNN